MRIGPSSSAAAGSPHGHHTIQMARGGFDSLSDKVKHHEMSLELHEAAVEGNVDKAICLAGGNVDLLVHSPITEKGETVLHVAAGAKQTHFVVEIMDRVLNREYLDMRDKKGNNVFCYAVMSGDKDLAQKMLDRNPELLNIRGGNNATPLYLAALFGQRDMASFLYEKSRSLEVVLGTEEEIKKDREDSFFHSIRNNLFDLALKLLNEDNSLSVLSFEEFGTALHMLAQNPSVFTNRSPGILNRVLNFFFPGMNLIDHDKDLPVKALELVKKLWQGILEQNSANIREYMHETKKVLFDAAKVGNSKLLEEILRNYPFLAHELDEDNRTIFHIAILHRHVSIFNLMDDLGFDKELIASYEDRHDNNLLHLAATYLYNPRPVSMVPGAALEMQQELKIFKEVEPLVWPSFRERRNKKGLTPRQVFTNNHKGLLRSGEKWMKETAGSCMLVATIIATVVFTAGFSVPGDYSDKDGRPRQLEKSAFRKFAMVDAIALSSSSISILIFLSILTSRYEEEDFLISLPFKLMVGLFTLVISVTTMMLSFSLSFFLDYKGKSKSIPIIVTVLVVAPAILFLFLYCRLLKDMFLSTFCSRFSSKPRGTRKLKRCIL